MSVMWMHLWTSLDPVSKYDVTIGNHIAKWKLGHSKTRLSSHCISRLDKTVSKFSLLTCLQFSSHHEHRQDETRQDSLVLSVVCINHGDQNHAADTCDFGKRLHDTLYFLQCQQNVKIPAMCAVKTLAVIRVTECRDHLAFHKLTTDITPRTIESLVVINAVVHVIFAVEAARRQRLLTFCAISITRQWLHNIKLW